MKSEYKNEDLIRLFENHFSSICVEKPKKLRSDVMKECSSSNILANKIDGLTSKIQTK